MPHRVILFVFSFVLLLVPADTSAQEQGKVGITMGFPQSVGVLWHVSEKVAVRPELSFSWNSSDSGTTESDHDVFATGISALFYLRKWDNLSTYISPRYSFGRASGTSASTDDGLSGDSEQTSRNHLFSGSFGAQYWMSPRFSVFGEIGLGYQRTSGESSFSLPAGIDPPPFIELERESSARSVATRSAVGVAFYF